MRSVRFPGSVGILLSGVAEVLREAVVVDFCTLWRWHENARTRWQLQQLPDYRLRDMGLTRLDVLAEARRPFWADIGLPERR